MQRCGLEGHPAAAAAELDPAGAWPRSEELQVLDAAALAPLGPLHGGPWPEPVCEAVVVPFAAPGQPPEGWLVAGITAGVLALSGTGTLAEYQQVLVARDDAVAVRGDGGREHLIIVRVAADGGGKTGGLNDFHLRPEQGDAGFRCFGWKAELGCQLVVKFVQKRVRRDQIMSLGAVLQQLRATPPRGYERSDQDVRVEADSHDTASNTSSSVRRGMISPVQALTLACPIRIWMWRSNRSPTTPSS